jgi:hypothetical protein
MGCIYVEALDELQSRLNTAITGQQFPLTFPVTLLNTIAIDSFIQVGQRQKVEGNDYLPCINILFNGVSEKYENIGAGLQLVAEVNLGLKLVFPLNDPDAQNILYDHSDQTGMLYFIAETLDVIHSRTDTGAYDPRLLVNASRPIHVEVGAVEKMADKLVCEIALTLTTRPYNINERRY